MITASVMKELNFALQQQQNFETILNHDEVLFQMRANALRLMTSSFSVPKADVEYPLSNLQRLLAFSDMEVVKLCCHWLFYKIFSGEQYILYRRNRSLLKFQRIVILNYWESWLLAKCRKEISAKNFFDHGLVLAELGKLRG